MAWVTYTKPDGTAVKAFHVTNRNDTPGGVDADDGQVIVDDVVTVDGKATTTGYVLDAVPDDWVKAGELAGEPTDPKGVTPEPDPRADLWLLGDTELRKIATDLGIDEGLMPLKKTLIYAIHDAREAKAEGVEPPPPKVPAKRKAAPKRAAAKARN